MKKLIAKISLVALVLMTFGMVSPASATPDGINDITLNVYSVPQSASSQEITATIPLDTTNGTYATGDSFTVSTSTGIFGGLQCSGGTADIDDDGTLDTCTTDNYKVVWTMGNTVAQPAATLEVPLAIPANTDIGRYYLEFEMANDAQGAVLFGVATSDTSDVNDNVIHVSTSVSPTVTLNISDSTNTSATTVCDLGILNETSLATCDYNVHVGTNMTGTISPNTIAIRAITDGAMTDGSGHSLTDANGTVCEGGAGGSGECYGMSVHGVGGWDSTEQNSFGTAYQTLPDLNDITPSAATIASREVSGSLDGGLNSGDYLEVTHAAVAGPATVPSSYSQDVIWTAVVFY